MALRPLEYARSRLEKCVQTPICSRAAIRASVIAGSGLGLMARRPARRVIPRPVEVTAPGLEVNVESFELKPIRVAVTIAEGTMLPGCSFDDCRVDYDARRIYTPGRWQSTPDPCGRETLSLPVPPRFPLTSPTRAGMLPPSEKRKSL